VAAHAEAVVGESDNRRWSLVWPVSWHGKRHDGRKMALGVDKSLTVTFEAIPLERTSASNTLCAGYFSDKFADHRLTKAVEIVDHQGERPRPADHIVLVIFEDAAGRIGVKGKKTTLGGGHLVEDRETVDDDPRLDGRPMLANSPITVFCSASPAHSTKATAIAP
jgi:hypothetical protein